MHYSFAVLLAASFAVPPLPAQADTTQSHPAADSAAEEVLVIGESNTRTYELADSVDIAADSAALLRKAVGANVVSNGPISGIAQYRGMSRFRISSKINGAVISPGGPNWMDAPLSYAPAAHLHSLEVYRGIAPVSAGLETIGGVINANTWSGEFARSGLKTHGRMRAGTQSINDGSLLSGAFVLASAAHRLRLSGLTESAADAGFSGGVITPTEYERNRFDLGYGYRAGRHTLQLDYGRSDTGNAGTPALPMDIQWIDADLAGLSYHYAGQAVRLQGKVYYSNIDHGMTNYHLRQPPPGGSSYRRNLTGAENSGFAFSAQVDDWTLGLEGHNEIHGSDIGNPNNPMFFVTNFNHAERRILGVFAEREYQAGDRWLLELGLRYKRVNSDARAVDATPASMGMPPAVALRDEFNAAGRSVSDNNLDWVARSWWRWRADTTLFAGLSRKSRAPSYQERYLWLPLQATAGLADGRLYTGNIDLQAEVAHEVELGVDWENQGFAFSPRVFYQDISDYIQGTVSIDESAVMLVRMMNAMNNTANPDPLQFNNVDAKLYGADLDWRYRISGHWSLNGVFNYVRGKRGDIDDNLYRVSPLNAFVAANYDNAIWGITLEAYLYGKQQDVSATNGELHSDGYALLNLRGLWRLSDRLRLGVGVDNLADRNYLNHLAGVNRVSGNPDIAPGDRLPGNGRGVFARLDYEW